MDPYLIIHTKSTFSDHQTLKLQEAPDMVPVGELPRHMLLSADRYLTGQVVPGSRVIATGIYSTFQSAKSVSGATVLNYNASDLLSRKVAGLLHYGIPISVWCTLKCLRRQPLDPVVPTHSAYNSLPKKRKTLARWRVAKASTSGLRRASHRVYLGVLVCGCGRFYIRPLTRRYSRYRESDNVSPLWRLEENLTGWYAAPRGHQRSLAG